MAKNYLKLAAAILEQHQLHKYIDILLGYWEKNPTTLGHGFSHVLKVAVEAYEIAKLNNYSRPEDLFVGGLFHDIYRPAEGQGGDEDQRLGADITSKLFNENNVLPALTEKVVAAIKSHDDWRNEENPPVFDLLVSTADKIVFDHFLADCYVWASNKYTREKTGKPVFTSFLQTMAAFVKYQQRAWEVMYKHPLKGTERAIETYLKTYQKASSNYLHDKTSKHFFQYLDHVAADYRRQEKKYLSYFKVPSAKISRIMSRC